MQCTSKSFRVILESVATSSNTEYFDISDLKIKGRDRVLDGNFTIFQDLDEHFTAKMDFYSDAAGVGEYKRVPFSMEELPLCEGLAKYGSYIEKTLKPIINTNLPVKGDICPVPAGTYYFKDVTLNADDWPDQVPRGNVKAVYLVLRDGEVVSECALLARIESKLIYQ